MPLIELKTDLKSLNFGADRPRGGDSPQPFIKIPIPPQDDQSATDIIPPSVGTGVLQDTIPGLGPILNNPVISSIRTLLNVPLEEFSNLGFGNNEGIIRGGATAAVRSGIDAIRISRFLATPQGLIFITKQNLLSGQSVKVEGSGGLLNDGPYSPLGTLGQSLGNAFGLHTLKQGVNPLEGVKNQPKPNNYLDAADPNLNSGYDKEKDNRLVVLKDAIDRETRTRFKGTILNGNEGSNIISYKGGPGSLLGLGLGRTSINFADPFQRTGKLNPNLIRSKFFEGGTSVSGVTLDPMDVANGKNSFLKEKLGTIVDQVSEDIFGSVEGPARKLGGLVSKIGTKIGGKAGSFIGGLSGQIENLGSIGNVLTGTVDDIFAPTDTDVISGNFTVFKNPRPPSENFNRYVRLSNVYGDIVSTPGGFNQKSNAIQSNGNRNNVFNNSVYQGANINNTNSQIQNANFGATLTQKNINDLQKGQVIRNASSARDTIDFRKTIIEERSKGAVKTVISLAPSYKNKNIHSRVNLGDPGSKAKSSTGILNYGLPANTLEALDKINAFTAYDSSGAPDTSRKPVNDLVQLRFRILNPGRTSTILHFRSFIDSFSDSYSSKWNSTQYVGRADTFYNYEGFDRQIALNFTVAVQSKAELIPVYKKLNHLASTLAPEYSEDGFMKGNLVKLTYGGYLFETPGFLTSVNYTIPENSPYEIAINENGDGDSSVTELPLLIKVSTNFTPIHDFLVEKVNNNLNPNAKYISLQNSTKKSMYEDEYKDARRFNPAIVTDAEGNEIDIVSTTADDLGISARTLTIDPEFLQKVELPTTTQGSPIGPQLPFQNVNTNSPLFTPFVDQRALSRSNLSNEFPRSFFSSV